MRRIRPAGRALDEPFAVTARGRGVKERAVLVCHALKSAVTLLGWLSGLYDFVDQAVPLLQERGVVRTEYSGTTLRDNLGLP